MSTSTFPSLQPYFMPFDSMLFFWLQHLVDSPSSSQSLSLPTANRSLLL